jgi:hypothetical protein
VTLKTVFVEFFRSFIAAFVALFYAENTVVMLSNTLTSSEPTRWNLARAFES